MTSLAHKPGTRHIGVYDGMLVSTDDPIEYINGATALCGTTLTKPKVQIIDIIELVTCKRCAALFHERQQEARNHIMHNSF